MRNTVQQEYKKRLGWGHSSMEDAIKFASLAGVKHLLLAHHDPNHTDKQLNELFARILKGSTIMNAVLNWLPREWILSWHKRDSNKTYAMQIEKVKHCPKIFADKRFLEPENCWGA